MKRFKDNKAFKFLGSVKLALWLFWLIIIVCFIGAILPEEMRGFVFGSAWFFALLFVFGLNIAACAIARMSFSVKKAGSTLVHLSVLLILFGSCLSYFFSIRGVMELEEGQSKDTVILGCKLHKLDFRVYLDHFAVSWYDSTPEKYDIRAYVIDREYKSGYNAEKSKEQSIGNTGYFFTVAEYYPDFGLDGKMKAYNKSALPNNPAVLRRIKGPKTAEERWVFANHPGMGLKDQNIKFMFDYQPMAKEYLSRVRVIDEKNNRTLNADIKVNSPLYYQGYSFYQAGYDQKDLKYTSLDVVKDPGVIFVFAGFLVLNAGLIVLFYPKLKLTFARKK
jgi:cytochrome c biogenesis protein ResB